MCVRKLILKLFPPSGASLIMQLENTCFSSLPRQVLSDNTLVNLVPGGADRFVEYEERMEYIQLVRNCRMCEGKTQV